jgi:hypothetical protein
MGFSAVVTDLTGATMNPETDVSRADPVAFRIIEFED